MFYNVLDRDEKTVKKEDRDSHTDANNMVQKLQNFLQNIESSQEANRITFMKQLMQEIPVLDENITGLYEQSIDQKFIDPNSDPAQMKRELDELETQFNKLDKMAEKYNHQQVKLDTQQTAFKDLETAREEISNRCLLWRSLDEFVSQTEKWKRTDFNEIDVKSIQAKSDQYYRYVSKLEKSLPANQVLDKLKVIVKQFREAMPIVSALSNDKLTETHWTEINTTVGKEINVAKEGFTLQDLIALDVNNFQEEIVAISTQATQEFKLTAQIEKIKLVWNHNDTFFKFKVDEKTEVNILYDLESIWTAIDETLAEINMILGSRYVKPLRKQAEEWKKNILFMSDLMDEWVKCQNQWRYFFKILGPSNKDISSALPNEAKMYGKITTGYKNKLMANTIRTNCPSPYKVCISKPTILNDLKQWN